MVAPEFFAAGAQPGHQNLVLEWGTFKNIMRSSDQGPSSSAGSQPFPAGAYTPAGPGLAPQLLIPISQTTKSRHATRQKYTIVAWTPKIHVGHSDPLTFT